MLQSFKDEITMGENVLTQVGKYYLALIPVDTVFGSTIVSQNNTITRNIIRGFAWYLSKELIEEITTGNSNLREMNVFKAVDDTAYNGLVSIVIEETGVVGIVDKNIGGFIPNAISKNRLITSLLIVGSKRLEQYLGIDHPLLNFSRMIGLNK